MMASTATTSGGWAASSPYLGPDANTASNSATLGADGNVVQPASSDVGAQLGQALSAYHTHQATATPAIAAAATPVPSSANSQGYGAAAASQNNADLGAALQASVPATTAATGYAAPSQNKLGIAVNTPTYVVPTTTATMANGTAAQTMTGVSTGTSSAQTAYISYTNAQGGTSWAHYDATTGQYVPVDSSTIDYAKTYGTNNESRGTTSNAGYDLSPPLVYLTDGELVASKDYSGLGTTFSLDNLNAGLAAAAAQKAANAQGLAAASQAGSQVAAATGATIASVNNNQDFINQLSDQMSNINTAAGVQAADQTTQNAQDALTSQLSTSGYQSGALGASARFGVGASVTAEGQGALSHEQAAANAYDADFAQLGQAASQQLSLADSETQQQASQDVQNIQDELSSMQAQLGQLDATTANQVNQHIAALQDQISAYQNSVASYQGTSQADANAFKAILTTASQIASIAAVAA